MTFDHRAYVPILLTKRGERSAIRDLDPAQRPRMTPLFAVSPVDWNFDLDEPSKTVDQHVRGLGRELATCWGTEPAFVDLRFFDDGALMADGSRPLVWLIDEGNQHGARLIPVVSIGRSSASSDSSDLATTICPVAISAWTRLVRVGQCFAFCFSASR